MSTVREGRAVHIEEKGGIGRHRNGDLSGSDGWNGRKKDWPLPYSPGRPSDAAGLGSAPRGPVHEKKNELEGSVKDPVRIYLKEIQKYPLLNEKDERSLAGRVARGDKRAREKMIESNLRLVVSIAKRYVNRGLPIQDLFEEGNIGLMKAVERFKAEKGCRFSTYATYWIKQSVERAIANQADTVRLPVHIMSDLSRINRAERELQAVLNRAPDIRELSESTGLSGRYVKKLNMISRKTYPLETYPPDDGAELSLMDRLEDDTYPAPLELIHEKAMSQKLARWLGRLDGSERAIIKSRFGLDDDTPKTLESIGRSLGVTRERVRQLEVRALGKLRDMVTEEGFLSLEAV